MNLTEAIDRAMTTDQRRWWHQRESALNLIRAQAGEIRHMRSGKFGYEPSRADATDSATTDFINVVEGGK